MNDKLKELSLRAKKRLQSMPAPKTAEDARIENENFALLEQQLYKQITQVGQKCN